MLSVRARIWGVILAVRGACSSKWPPRSDAADHYGQEEGLHIQQTTDPASFQPQNAAGLDAIDYMDFLVQRRAGPPFSQNRYYVAAPMETKKLIQTMEAIEEVVCSM